MEAVRFHEFGGPEVRQHDGVPLPVPGPSRPVDPVAPVNPEEFTALVALVRDGGAPRVEIRRRIPLAELPALHAEAAAGRIPGKVVVLHR